MIVRLLHLSQEVRDLVVKMRLSERHARALLEVPEQDERLRILKYAEQKEYSVSAWEKLIKDEKEKNISREIIKARKIRIRPIVKDLRLFINSLERGVETMRASGLEVNMQREKQENCMRIVIEIESKK